MGITEMKLDLKRTLLPGSKPFQEHLFLVNVLLGQVVVVCRDITTPNHEKNMLPRAWEEKKSIRLCFKTTNESSSTYAGS